MVKNIEKIEHIAVKTLKKITVQDSREKGYLYFHGRRVADLAVRLYADIDHNNGENRARLLYIAGLFHDVGKGKAHHAVAGAKLLPKILKDELNKSELEQVQTMVREHNLRESPNMCQLDSQVLQDADTLDHFGVQGIWLSIYYTAKDNNNQLDMLKYYRSEEHQEYARKKFSGLNFVLSRKIFKERLAYQSEFLRLIAEEDLG